MQLNMADGAYNDFRGPYPRHPQGIRQTWAWSSPTWQCPTSTTSPTYQPGATTGVMGPSASNPDIKSGIPHTQIFWQLTRQSLLM
jgi:hypothetical protein